MQPTFTQVPPIPQVVPCGDGCTKSANPTLTPRSEASFDAASPPDPPPFKSHETIKAMNYR
jgi:hypothetical protein